MNRSALALAAITLVLAILPTAGNGQTAVPEILIKGTVRDQMNYISEKTLIYENYRAIREDMFQLLKNNAIDSLEKAKKSISAIKSTLMEQNNRIDSLRNILTSTREELREMTKTKNEITFLGISINKSLYNSVMWIAMAGLVFLLLVGYLAFKRTYIVTRNTRNEINELKNEFEEYRKKTRLDREKMSMDHFKEIQKLRKM
jgi:hypothetical protein